MDSVTFHFHISLNSVCSSLSTAAGRMCLYFVALRMWQLWRRVHFPECFGTPPKGARRRKSVRFLRNYIFVVGNVTFSTAQQIICFPFHLPGSESLARGVNTAVFRTRSRISENNRTGWQVLLDTPFCFSLLKNFNVLHVADNGEKGARKRHTLIARTRLQGHTHDAPQVP